MSRKERGKREKSEREKKVRVRERKVGRELEVQSQEKNDP